MIPEEIRLCDLVHLGHVIRRPMGKWYFTFCGINMPESLAYQLPMFQSATYCSRCEAQQEFDKENE